MDQHQADIAAIQQRVKLLHEQRVPIRIYHGSTNSTRPMHRDASKVVDTSGLNRVIKIDAEKKTIICEPNVPMDELVASTLPHGLLPPVVPEFPGITVGGSFCGTAGESSSFKHGFFDRAVIEMEIVLADGELVRCSRESNEDLFHGSVGAFGTLGVATLFEVELIETGKYVEVTYRPVHSFEECTAVVQSVVKEPYDYIDGIMFRRDLGAVILGRTTAERTHSLQRFTRSTDPWFYVHAKSMVSKSSKNGSTETETKTSAYGPVESVPVEDYLFRYDRGAFWMGRHAFSMFHAPFDPIFRALLDPLTRTRKMYQALHHSGHAARFIIQDLIIPADNAKEFMEFVDDTFGIYPLWVCPIKGDSTALFHRLPAGRNSSPQSLAGNGDADQKTSTTCNNDLTINIGVWGPPPAHPYGSSDSEVSRFVDDNRRIEDKVKSLGGLKWLYARNYYEEEEFWSIYDRKTYEDVRRKWRADTLPSIWEKVGRKGDDPKRSVSKVRGVLYAVANRDSILSRKSAAKK